MVINMCNLVTVARHPRSRWKIGHLSDLFPSVARQQEVHFRYMIFKNAVN